MPVLPVAVQSTTATVTVYSISKIVGVLISLIFVVFFGSGVWSLTNLEQSSAANTNHLRKELKSFTSILVLNSVSSIQPSKDLRSFTSITMKSVLGSGLAPIPTIIYGTAWKKDQTARFVEQALRQGFRAIDTACQPRHYHEKGVGDAIDKVLSENIIPGLTREQLFLQTKFTPPNGQDLKTIPYDPNAPIVDQVRTSFATSLRNLRTTYLDSLVLHSPMETLDKTIEVWRVFEELYKEGNVRHLGISNTYNLRILRALYDVAEIKPSFVQNRFYRDSGYDKELRLFCDENNIKYQSFWTLTANPHILQSDEMNGLVAKYGKTPQQLFFKYVQSKGIVPLTGTTDANHMAQDLEVTSSLSLTEDDIATIDKLL